jgi:hypothetical protein
LQTQSSKYPSLLKGNCSQSENIVRGGEGRCLKKPSLTLSNSVSVDVILKCLVNMSHNACL